MCSENKSNVNEDMFIRVKVANYVKVDTTCTFVSPKREHAWCLISKLPSLSEPISSHTSAIYAVSFPMYQICEAYYTAAAHRDKNSQLPWQLILLGRQYTWGNNAFFCKIIDLV